MIVGGWVFLMIEVPLLRGTPDADAYMAAELIQLDSNEGLSRQPHMFLRCMQRVCTGVRWRAEREQLKWL